MRINTIFVLFVLLVPSAFAVTRTVKAAGGGTCTVIQTCVNLMAAGDTTTVFSGTYSENVTVTAGTAGNYKTINVNGSDVVTVLTFTLDSHTVVSGFVFNNTGSCFSLNSTATDVIIGPNNSLTSCGTLNINIGNSFIYFKGNTWAYAGCVPPNPVATCGRSINADASHVLIEGNDFSHYQLGIVLGSNTGAVSNIVIRNNTFHDQLETEAGSNGHTDSVFSEPANGVSNVVIEGNNQYNAVGVNAKGFLSQDDAGCSGTCTQLIIRHNITSRLGSGTITNDKSWPHVVAYNNTIVDNNEDASTTFGISDNSITAPNAAFKNQIYYYTQSSINDFNPYACNNTNCSFGNNLYWCTGTCTNIHTHTYGSGTFTTDSGNLHSDPLFVSYVSAGSPSNNFHLQSGSPAKNAGTFLTTANGSGSSSTALIVNDASYFQDGYGLSNTFSTVSPDCISITTVGNHICITAVNYATNTLTLASAISWTTGDSVWLYSKSDGVQVLTGTAPDMGALPFSNATASPTPAPALGMFAELKR